MHIILYQPHLKASLLDAMHSAMMKNSQAWHQSDTARLLSGAMLHNSLMNRPIGGANSCRHAQTAVRPIHSTACRPWPVNKSARNNRLLIIFLDADAVVTVRVCIGTVAGPPRHGRRTRSGANALITARTAEWGW